MTHKTPKKIRAIMKSARKELSEPSFVFGFGLSVSWSDEVFELELEVMSGILVDLDEVVDDE